MRSPSAINTPRLATVFLVVFVDLLGFSLILPLLPYYAKQFNASPFVIGLLAASNALAQIIGIPIIGRLSDRFGRRPLILLGTAAGAVSFLILGLAKSLPVLFLARVLDGLLGGNVALAQAYITDITDEEHRAKSLGIIGAAFGIGFIFGPALGGFLSRWGYGVPSFAAAGLSLANFLWVLAALPESHTPERRAALGSGPGSRPPVTASALLAALRRPVVGPLLTTRLFYAFAFGVFQSSFALWAATRLSLTAQSTSFVLAYVGVLSVLVQGVAIGPLTRKLSERTLIVAGIPILAASLLAWGFVPSVALLLVVLAPMALAAGVLNVALTSSLTKAVSREEVGGSLGLATALQGIASVAAPVVGGLLLQRVGGWSLGAVGAVVLAALAAFAAARIRPPEQPAQPVPAAPAREQAPMR
jgi:DHA1 family tetracycline resistance protein-like MFS transporter